MFEYAPNGELRARIWQIPENIESSAWDQIKNMCLHPCVTDPIAIMPDVHAGNGVTIGAVVPVVNAYIPNAVGTDIGCGMIVMKTSLKLSDIKPIIEDIVTSVKRRIPLGYSHRSNNNLDTMHKFCPQKFVSLCEEIQSEKEYGTDLLNQIGTLGGGNHFIEFQIDDDENVYVMIHSGSRNFGAKIANKFCKIAKEHSQHNIPKDLEILEMGTDEFNEYQMLMIFAVEFAYQNRMVMLEDVKKSLLEFFPECAFEKSINIPHNYASAEMKNEDGDITFIHRKGATRVTESITGIIPGSMGTPSYIVTGTNNKLSYYSCSHGGGRIMSRRKAKESISMETFAEDMKNVHCGVVEQGHLDESPRAYKNIDEVMELQSDLVKIITKLYPVRTIKG